MYDIELWEKRSIRVATEWWNFATKLFSNSIGAMPEIKVNKRLTSTAGRAWLESGKIEYSAYFLEEYTQDMFENTIPHELAHIIAYRMYGEKNHGKAWKLVALALYGYNNTYHDYIPKNRKR